MNTHEQHEQDGIHTRVGVKSRTETSMMRATSLVVLALAALVGCSDDDRGGGARDSGPDDPRDAGAGRDASIPDAGTIIDGGGADAGAADASCSEMATGAHARWLMVCHEQYETCPGWPDPSYACSECARRGDFYSGWWSEQMFAAYTECRAASCDSSDDACAATAYSAMTTTAESDELAALCTARAGECGESLPCFSRFYAGVRSELLPEYRLCFEGPCAALNSCFQSVRPPG